MQLVLVQDDQHDRFYNALYKKMADSEIIGANNKISSLYFHIIHRAIQQDANVPRAKAFIKRLLQMTLTLPPGKACGALIVISKILKSRPELINFSSKSLKFMVKDNLAVKDEEQKMVIDDESDDEEEVYKDVVLDDEGKVMEKTAEVRKIGEFLVYCDYKTKIIILLNFRKNLYQNHLGCMLKM